MTPAEAARADLARRMVQVEKMAALGRMAAGIVHEVNNPLSAIAGLTEVLLRRPDTPPEHLATLLKIHAEIDRIQKLMGGMLGYSRGALPAMGPVDLRRVAEETLALASPELKRRRVEAVLEAAPGLPPALGDEHALKQVFFNLVLNAAQAIDDRGGSVWLRLEECDGRLQVELADDGPGVPPEIADRIFEPFFTTKPEGQGTGLGLFISVEVVRRHGGRLWVEPRPGGGAVFGFDLPRA